MAKYEISTEYQRKLHGGDYYDVKAEHGYVEAVYRFPPGWLGVANVFVEPEHRGNGLGKALLSATLDLAQELDAKLLYAGLISRESICLFGSVFGPESLTIARLGTFTPVGEPDRYDASAHFSLELR